MLDVFKDEHFTEYYGSGFVETGMWLPPELVDRIRAHYKDKALARNDFPKFFEQNEHQAYLNGRVLGTIFNLFPGMARKMVTRLYDKAYERAVYADQTFIAEVVQHLLSQDLGKFFKTRYLVVGYDMFLGNDSTRPGAGIHTDMPTFHHFYETENDVTLYIPLVDLTADNGGRLKVLPESKLKVACNILLKQLMQHFGGNTAVLDENGYIDPEKIPPEELKAFIQGKAYQQFMAYYKNVIALATKRYAGEFETCDQRKGKVLLWNNKNFHTIEPWRNTSMERAVYIIRLFPIYDTKIKLRERLHGRPFNNHLIDTQTNELHRQDGVIDLSRIPQDYKLAL